MEIFEYLLAHDADPNLRIREDPVLVAITRGTKFLRPLLKAGTDVQLCPKAMEFAVWQNKLDAIQVLVEEAGMAPNHPHPDGHFPLTTAVRDNHPEILRYLLSKKPDLSKVQSLVEYTVHRDLMECMKLEVEAGLDMNMRHPDGPTPVSTAVRDNRLEMLKYVLEHGANPNAPGQDNEAPIFMATSRENPELLKTLLTEGADVSKLNVHGQTALHTAAWHGHIENVKALIEKGMDVNALDKYEKAPMDYVAERGHDEIVMLLLESMG